MAILNGNLLILVSSVWTIGLIVTVWGISASTESGRFLDWVYLGFIFRQINPYFFAAVGIACAIGLSVLGAAWCVCRRDSVFVLSLLETVALCGFATRLGHLPIGLISGFTP